MQINRIITKTLISMVLCLFIPGRVEAVHPPEEIPIFTEAEVDMVVAHDPNSGLYTYQYTLTNPAINTGEITYFEMNISIPELTLSLPSAGLNLESGGA